jgi:hypothetical protein
MVQRRDQCENESGAVASASDHAGVFFGQSGKWKIKPIE